jgi:hypothetical protein
VRKTLSSIGKKIRQVIATCIKCTVRTLAVTEKIAAIVTVTIIAGVIIAPFILLLYTSLNACSVKDSESLSPSHQWKAWQTTTNCGAGAAGSDDYYTEVALLPTREYEKLNSSAKFQPIFYINWMEIKYLPEGNHIQMNWKDDQNLEITAPCTHVCYATDKQSEQNCANTAHNVCRLTHPASGINVTLVKADHP